MVYKNLKTIIKIKIKCSYNKVKTNYIIELVHFYKILILFFKKKI
jgi:hypothetical protein